MKHFHLWTLLIILIYGYQKANAADTPDNNSHSGSQRPKIALVLSGGGAKGMAHIGVLKVLERAGLPIDIITGTSMGSIVGGVYACGHSAEELDSVVRAQKWSFVLFDREDQSKKNLKEREKMNTYVISKTFNFGKKQNNPGSGGIIAGKNINPLLYRLTNPYHDSIDFNKLPIPFACVATDAVKNTEHVFHSGILSKAMRASMSIPGVFSPVRIGDEVLIDGGMRNNFPADIAKEMGADIIIGVDVQDELKTASELNTAVDVLMQVIDHNCKNKYEENLSITDIHIRVNTKGYNAASFSSTAIDTLIRRGEEAAMTHWDEIVALSKKVNEGRKISKKTGASFLAAADNNKSETDSANKKKDIIFNVGARFDSEEMVALQANAELPINTKLPMDAEVTLRLGKRLMARADLTMSPISFFRPTISYIYRNNDINFYEYGDKSFTATYHHHAVNMNLFNFMIRNLNVSIGTNWDYYHFHSLLRAQEAEELDDNDTRDKHYFSYVAKAWFSSENDWYFPTSGTRFQARYAYYTDNFAQLDGGVGMRDYSMMVRVNIPLGNKLSIQPMVYGRWLFHDHVPLILSNIMGGEWPGHYIEQQLPFAGVCDLETAWNKLSAVQLQTQYRLTTNNVLLLRMAAGQDANELEDMLKHQTMLGASLSYYLNTMFGPLGGTIGYSNLTKKFNYYINLGFVF